MKVPEWHRRPETHRHKCIDVPVVLVVVTAKIRLEPIRTYSPDSGVCVCVCVCVCVARV